jgi:hypothetical protein
MNSIITNHNEQIIDQLLNNDDGDSIINDNDIYCGSWFIDRIPDFNILNDLEFNRNQQFDLQLDQARRLLINRQIEFNYNSDYIPFSNEPIIETFESIEILVDDRLPVNEDDCDCCICMESNISSKICQLNCGHKFCADCTLENVRRNYKSPLCPLCRTNIITITVQTQETYQKFI